MSESSQKLITILHSVIMKVLSFLLVVVLFFASNAVDDEEDAADDVSRTYEVNTIQKIIIIIKMNFES